MRCLVSLLFLVSLSAVAQDYGNEESTPREAYAKGYKDGFREGYEQARKDLGGRHSQPPVVSVPKPAPYPITVTSARYGTSSRNCDVTRQVARRVNGRLNGSVEVSNNLCGDPAPGQRKSLEITYVCGNRAKTASAYEHRTAYMDCND